MTYTVVRLAPRVRSFGALVERTANARSHRSARLYHQPSFRRHASSRSIGAKESPQTLTEKILQRHAVGLPEGKIVRSGDYVQIQPHRCLTHDNTWPVATKFMSTGATRIKDPSQLVFALDHDVQNKSKDNLRKYEQIEAFAKVEELFVWPGTLCVGSDSHSNMYGALGSLGVSIVRSDAAGVFATGKGWFQCPPVVQVTLMGTLPYGVTGKDVIVALCGLFPTDVLNHSVEFVGSEETMASIPVDSRLTISNMSTEWSATSAIFPIDATLERWLRYKATEAAMQVDRTTRERITHEMVDELYDNPLRADPGAHYAKKLYLDLDTLSPYVSGPNSVKISTPLHELTPQIKINKAYIAARVFQVAAETNGGRIPKVADDVKLYIAAASVHEQAMAEADGSWQTLLDAGAIPLPAACGPCIGLGTGLLEDGEVGVSASNLAHAYLASPEVVAASALSGLLSGPGFCKLPENYSGVKYGYGDGSPETIESKLGSAIEQLDSLVDRIEGSVPSGDGATQPTTGILPGFPSKISGEIVFCDAEHLDTDNIYAGRYTYRDDITVEGMAEVCMENYDPEFKSIAKPHDILVSGYNFGCGSSREQAATALLAKKIPLVVAGSFSNIFVRNSINNALLTLEVPRLVERLRANFASSDKARTRRTGWTLTWDVARSVVKVQEGPDGHCWEEKVGEFAEKLQDIIAKGGLMNWVKHEISTTSA
ncbi:mitochondrial Homoaconitase [Metarhizium rileyi]|uniref:Homoaconitase, mitochondrial n=1 Tax=Metarhizium rileyi (strain RCEF 4871) TaxID=1649241 RepID=A0A5C6G325_METRR|nr:mitochondrial Homoaconitase [Metarhizium rileyi]